MCVRKPWSCAKFLFPPKASPTADIPALRKKADDLRDRVLNNGDDFGEMAKHFSDSPTAQQSGELGSFQRSQLDPKIAEKVFALNHDQMTDVIETKTGFEILQVRERYEAGEQPLEKVEPEITNKLYEQKMEPGMRTYLDDAAGRQLHPDQAGIYRHGGGEEPSRSRKSPRRPTRTIRKRNPSRRFGILPKKKSGT